MQTKSEICKFLQAINPQPCTEGKKHWVQPEESHTAADQTEICKKFMSALPCQIPLCSSTKNWPSLNAILTVRAMGNHAGNIGT